MKENPLLKLEAFGQSIWMDFIRRGTISSGELKQLIEEDGLSGVTSNPSIFEKAIADADGRQPQDGGGGSAATPNGYGHRRSIAGR